MGIETGQDFTMDGNVPTSVQGNPIEEVARVDVSPALPAGMGAVYRARAANRARQAAETDPGHEVISQEQRILSTPSVRRTLFVGNSTRSR